MTTGRWLALLGAWVLAVVVGVGLVGYGFGPYNHDREQRRILGDYRTELAQAAAEATGLGGVTVASAAPAVGAPVAILEIGSIRLQEVVVEGVGSSQTDTGPGHVPGTAGPGEPGNSVVVGRRAAFGGPFADVRNVDIDQEIVVSTRTGQSVYRVVSIEKVSFGGEGSADAIAATYGPSDDDRLTLVTSASRFPWGDSRATVVVAELDGKPFPSTPQGGLPPGAAGVDGDRGATASVVVAFGAYGVVMVGAVLLYRRLSARTAYLLAVAPIIAVTVIAGETLARLFPAWA